MTPDPEPGDEAQDAAGEAEPRHGYDWKRHLPRLVLLAGLAAVAISLAPSIPRHQTLVFHLGEGLRPVRRLEATWTRYNQDTPSGGVRLTFPEGAPASVRHRISVPNGEYVLTIVVERVTPETTSRGRATLAGKRTIRIRYVRRVDLEGGETIIPLWQED